MLRTQSMELSQCLVLDEPIHGAINTHSDKGETLQGSARSLTRCSWGSSTNADGIPSPLPLPKGCAVGIPVFASFPARPLPEGKALLSTAMAFVQRDAIRLSCHHGARSPRLLGCGHNNQALRLCASARAEHSKLQSSEEQPQRTDSEAVGGPQGGSPLTSKPQRR